MPGNSDEKLELLGKPSTSQAEILTDGALDFILKLNNEFASQREKLLQFRTARQVDFDKGVWPDFLSETIPIRSQSWQVAPVPKDLQDRRIEITGPVERKMMINALNCGAKVFMADFEDSLAPTWENLIEGQKNLKEAVRKTLSFNASDGKIYKLQDRTATLLIRPRGWHLLEKHVLWNDRPISATLFDFGLYFFHNVEELMARGTGPYFYLPKLESHLEARLWNDVFVFVQELLRVPRGTIRATVLIETIPAAFEMDEILYELHEHVSGLNAGRWDYIFSIIKKFRGSRQFLLPDRAQITMAVPFMRAYTDLLVKTCHRRNAHAIGGMAAFIPSRRDPKINEVAFTKVKEDKEREALAGFDGTWIAHPDLVRVAQDPFDKVLSSNCHQKHCLRENVSVSAQRLLDMTISGGTITEAGIRNNISVSLQYLERWLNGVGATGIFNLMEDVATAEIARAQLWQWLRHGARTLEGELVTPGLYTKLRDDELLTLGGVNVGRFKDAIEILDGLILNDEFTEFLTLPAYRQLP